MDNNKENADRYQFLVDEFMTPFAKHNKNLGTDRLRTLGYAVISKINNRTWRQVWNPTSILGLCETLEHLRIPEINDDYAYFVAIITYDGSECVLIDSGTVYQAFAEVMAELEPTGVLYTGLALDDLSDTVRYQSEIDKLLEPFAQRIINYCLKHQRVLGGLIIAKINQKIWQRISGPESELNTYSELDVLRINEITNDSKYYMAVIACDKPEYSLVNTELVKQTFEEVMTLIKPPTLTQTTVVNGK
jgi:hypothetical protein